MLVVLGIYLIFRVKVYYKTNGWSGYSVSIVVILLNTHAAEYFKLNISNKKLTKLVTSENSFNKFYNKY